LHSQIFVTDLSSDFRKTRTRGAIVLLLVFAMAWAVGGRVLLTRPFWMDELHSWLLISDPDAGHAMSALANGADYNPPTYYLVARVLTVFGPVTEFRLRMLSLLFTAATMLAVYLMISRRASIAAAVGSCLLMAGHQLMILQSTEARFYALWLCLLMWYCWLLTKSYQQTSAIRIQRISLGILAAAVCTTHYFGIISIGLVTAAWTWAMRRDRGCVFQGVGLMIIAVLAVAACLPMLAGQKAALTCATWVKAPTVARSFEFFGQFVPLLSVAICSFAAFAGWFSRQQVSGGSKETNSVRSTPPSRWSVEHGVLLSLLGMPLVLIGFSWLVQPALVDRYAIVAVAGLVPVCAWLISRATPTLQRAAVIVVAVLLCINIQHGSDTWDYNLQKHYALQQQLKALPNSQIVVFEDRIDFWLLQNLQRGQPCNHTPTNWYQLDFNAEQLSQPSNLRTVQRDVGRRVAKWYPGQFPMLSINELDHTEGFVVVPYIDKPWGAIRFGDQFHVQTTKTRLRRMVRSPMDRIAASR